MTATFSSLIAAAAPVAAIFLAGCLPQQRAADSSAVALPAQTQRQENPGVLAPPLRFSFDSLRRQGAEQRLQAFLEARNREPLPDPCPITDPMKTWTPPAIPPVPMPRLDPGTSAVPMPNPMASCVATTGDSLRQMLRVRPAAADTIRRLR
jgi:hypothetical protein